MRNQMRGIPKYMLWLFIILGMLAAIDANQASKEIIQISTVLALGFLAVCESIEKGQQR